MTDYAKKILEAEYSPRGDVGAAERLPFLAGSDQFA